MVRYFALNSDPAQPYGLMRMLIDNEAKTLITQSWSSSDGWRDSEYLARLMFTGDPRLDEITEQHARELFPDAFG